MPPGVADVLIGNLLTVGIVSGFVWLIFLMIDLVDWIDEQIKPPDPPEPPAAV